MIKIDECKLVTRGKDMICIPVSKSLQKSSRLKAGDDVAVYVDSDGSICFCLKGAVDTKPSPVEKESVKTSRAAPAVEPVTSAKPVKKPSRYSKEFCDAVFQRLKEEKGLYGVDAQNWFMAHQKEVDAMYDTDDFHFVDGVSSESIPDPVFNDVDFSFEPDESIECPETVQWIMAATGMSADDAMEYYDQNRGKLADMYQNWQDEKAEYMEQ